MRSGERPVWYQITDFLGGVVAGFWGTLTEMAPYLLFGFFVAGVLSVVVRPETVERHLGGRGIWSIVKAAAFGVPLPLCSCGVIPVSASLRRHGASRGATTAFLLSTPQTGVDSIMVTLSLLGPVFAVFRPIAALVTGIFGGSLVSLAEGNGDTSEPAPKCTDACCASEAPRNRLAHVLTYGFVTLPGDLAKPLLVGLVLAGVIWAAVPRDIASAVGTGVVGMLVMMVVGVPLYVCATASVPIAAALIAKGVSPGAALVFLMTGPATNAATITVIWKLMGRRNAVLYLAAVVLSAFGCGALLNFIYEATQIPPSAPPMWMLPRPVGIASAIVLMAVLGYALFGKRVVSEAEGTTEAPGVLEVKINGMTCSHCVQTVKRALSECKGVRSVEVELEGGRALVDGEGLDPEELRRAVESVGYEARLQA